MQTFAPKRKGKRRGTPAFMFIFACRVGLENSADLIFIFCTVTTLNLSIERMNPCYVDRPAQISKTKRKILSILWSKARAIPCGKVFHRPVSHGCLRQSCDVWTPESHSRVIILYCYTGTEARDGLPGSQQEAVEGSVELSQVFTALVPIASRTLGHSFVFFDRDGISVVCLSSRV